MKMTNIIAIPCIAVLCYCLIEFLKKILTNNHSIKQFYPFLSALSGMLFAILTYWTEPSLMVADSPLESALVGVVSGLCATGGYEIKKKTSKDQIEETSIHPSPRYFITGDKHGHYHNLIKFCKTNHLNRNDVIFILGDSGFNYYGDERDDNLKKLLSKQNVTLFCIHGNKENRPQNIPTYGVRSFCGGLVYYEPKYPNLFFAKDGEIYTFNEKEFIVIGGAHSVDKIRCLHEDLPFWHDEMPCEETKQLVEYKLKSKNHKIYGFLTHTCPISCLPTEMFISTQRASNPKANTQKKETRTSTNYPLDIDRSTEEWFESLMQKSDFKIWYCGHYHVDKELGKVHLMHKRIIPLFEATQSTF